MNPDVDAYLLEQFDRYQNGSPVPPPEQPPVVNTLWIRGPKDAAMTVKNSQAHRWSREGLLDSDPFAMSGQFAKPHFKKPPAELRR